MKPCRFGRMLVAADTTRQNETSKTGLWESSPWLCEEKSCSSIYIYIYMYMILVSNARICWTCWMQFSNYFKCTKGFAAGGTLPYFC